MNLIDNWKNCLLTLLYRYFQQLCAILVLQILLVHRTLSLIITVTLCFNDKTLVTTSFDVSERCGYTSLSKVLKIHAVVTGFGSVRTV